MIEEWLDLCVNLACTPPAFRDGGRKIFRNISLTVKDLNDINLEDAGYTVRKLSMLKGYYYHEESIKAAQEMWAKRLGQNTYGSTCFTCFNHFVKGGSVNASRAKHASVLSPCLQSVVITQKPRKMVEVDIFYRTTEFIKKFAGDIIFLREMLLFPNFKLDNLEAINFHFANSTLHFMYYPILFIHLAQPLQVMAKIKKADEGFHDLVVKSASRYLIPEFTRGIENHSQSMQVHRQMNGSLTKRQKKEIVEYLYANHKGYKKKYVPPEKKK